MLLVFLPPPFVQTPSEGKRKVRWNVVEFWPLGQMVYAILSIASSLLAFKHHKKKVVLLASKRQIGAQAKSRSKLLAKVLCAVTANKRVPAETEEFQTELPQCWLLVND